MAKRLIVFDGASLIKLLVHYTQESQRPDADSSDKIPLDAQLVWMGPSQYIHRWLGLGVVSETWDAPIDPIKGPRPLHIRYEGNRLLRWSNKDELPQQWTYEFEHARRK